MLRCFQRTGRGKVLRWTINGRQPSSRTSWTLPEHQPGINGKQTGRLLNSPSSTDRRNHANLRHRRRQRRKPEPLPSCRNSVARFWNLGEEAHSTHARYIVFCFTFDIIGPLVISLCHPDLGCKASVLQSPSRPPLLLLLFTASLCLLFQSRVKSPLASSHLFTISSLLSVR